MKKLLPIALVAAVVGTGDLTLASDEWSTTPFCQSDEDGPKTCIVGERGRIHGHPEDKAFFGYSCTDDSSPEARSFNIGAHLSGRPRSDWAPTGDTIMLTLPVWESWLNRLGVRTRDPKVSLRWSNGQRERIKTRFERFDREEPEGVIDLMWHIVDTEQFIEKMKRTDRLDVTLPFFGTDPIKVRFRFVNAMASIRRAMKECGLVESALGDFR